MTPPGALHSILVQQKLSIGVSAAFIARRTCRLRHGIFENKAEPLGEALFPYLSGILDNKTEPLGEALFPYLSGILDNKTEPVGEALFPYLSGTLENKAEPLGEALFSSTNVIVMW